MVSCLACVTCDACFTPDEHTMTCPRCGPELGTLDYRFDLDTLATRYSRPAISEGLATWLPLLPIAGASSLPPLPLGPTPLIKASRLARHLGLKDFWLKLDSFLPSLSLKDRASALALAQSAEWGSTTIIAASTGNAASSLATLAAATGQRAVLVVPEDAPRAKLAQIALHGGVLVPIRGTYDQAFDLSTRVAALQSWYVRSTAVNPVLAEGKKTVAMETALQLEWRVGDVWYVGVGDGCILGSLWKGLSELLALGWIDTMPALIGVQASGAAPLAHAWESGRPVEPWPLTDTCADSIAVGHPRDWVKALRAARASGGAIRTVPDERIAQAMRLLADHAGVLAEPAGAASVAGVLTALEQGQVGKSDRVVALITGHGLKDQAALRRMFRAPTPVAATPEAVLAAAEAWRRNGTRE